ncbi:uncharacterized protein BDR25DRAFT_361130 [Lindgomyces ingoldianus]|uniref:Uncharacterized protein n=1 Tax=Lindgomyces ingoldianus TaxID=673940 RepID=A0ACB6QDD3_9PLEO|nr:uncharacterized protein BDR25DRAFT_361130 [Lindgomyces ingoldianus]KAF2464906.1 hypothetical protein BDR25DRAFT_361130 [Lindgomyces ingoldianus]
MEKVRKRQAGSLNRAGRRLNLCARDFRRKLIETFSFLFPGKLAQKIFLPPNGEAIVSRGGSRKREGGAVEHTDREGGDASEFTCKASFLRWALITIRGDCFSISMHHQRGINHQTLQVSPSRCAASGAYIPRRTSLSKIDAELLPSSKPQSGNSGLQTAGWRHAYRLSYHSETSNGKKQLGLAAALSSRLKRIERRGENPHKRSVEYIALRRVSGPDLQLLATAHHRSTSPLQGVLKWLPSPSFLDLPLQIVKSLFDYYNHSQLEYWKYISIKAARSLRSKTTFKSAPNWRRIYASNPF